MQDLQKPNLTVRVTRNRKFRDKNPPLVHVSTPEHIYKLLLDILMIKNGIDYFPGISLLFVTPVFFKKGLKAEFGNDNNCSIKLFNQLNNLSN